MIHLNEYILNDDIVNLLEELINAKQVVSENMISDDDIVKLFESNELNFEPKNENELKELFSEIGGGDDNSSNTEAIDELNEKWIAFCNKNFKSIKDKMPFKLKADENSNLPNTISFDNIAIGIRSEGFVCGDFNSKNKTFGKKFHKSIKYDYGKSFLVNLLLLLEKANLLKQVFDGSCDDGYLKLNIKDTSKFTLEDAVKLSKSSNDKHNEDGKKNEDIKKVEKEVIEDNKDLIKQLLVKANTNAEKVTSVINKICKGIKTDESTVLGLTVMICGMLMSIKKNGKGNKIAVRTLAEKIVKITSNKKSGIRNILK